MANSKQYILSLFPDNNNNEITAADVRIFVNAIFDEEIDIVDIIDNLFSTNGQVPLSANQGRILDDKISANTVLINTKEDNLGLGSRDQVLSIDLNNNKVWRTIPNVTETIVYDGLDSVSSSHALAGNQGRILDDKITNTKTDISSNTSLISINTADIIINSDRITVTEADIITIGDATTVNDNRINTNLNNININSNDITVLEAHIPRLDSEITDLDANIVANAALISGNATAIDSNTTLITNLTSRVGVNEANIADLQVKVGVADIPAMQSQLDLNTANIITNSNGISSNITQISLNSAAISTNATSIGVISTNTNTNTTNINTNTAGIAANGVRIAATESDIIANKVITDTNTLNIVSNLAKIENNESDIQANLVKINDNENITTQNTTDIYNNKLDIEVLQTESIQHFTDTNANFVLTENNRENIINLNQDLANTNQTHSALALEVSNKEEFLNAPDRDNMVLASKRDGTRVWVDNALSELTFGVVDSLDQNGNVSDALSANMGYELNQLVQARENYLGLPRLNGMVLSSSQIGERTWVESNVLDIDYGSFFGAGFRLLSINIIDSIGGLIDNTKQGASRQLTCMATYDNGDSTPTVTVDATDSVDWESANEAAYTIRDGVGGGIVFCTTQTVGGQSYSSIPVRARLIVNGTTRESSINIEIDNTPIVSSIMVMPNPMSTSINNSVQATATATYTHNNWLGLETNITNSSSWVSSNIGVATVNTANGIVTGVTSGNATITVTKTPSLDNIQGTASVNII